MRWVYPPRIWRMRTCAVKKMGQVSLQVGLLVNFLFCAWAFMLLLCREPHEKGSRRGRLWEVYRDVMRCYFSRLISKVFRLKLHGIKRILKMAEIKSNEIKLNQMKGSSLSDFIFIWHVISSHRIFHWLILYSVVIPSKNMAAVQLRACVRRHARGHVHQRYQHRVRLLVNSLFCGSGICMCLKHSV